MHLQITAKPSRIDPLNQNAYSGLAWLFATASKDSLRDGKKAVEYALKAAYLTQWEDADTLDILAAAYAEAGNFAEAIKWENKALSFPEYEKSEGEAARERLQALSGRKTLSREVKAEAGCQRLDVS